VLGEISAANMRIAPVLAPLLKLWCCRTRPLLVLALKTTGARPALLSLKLLHRRSLVCPSCPVLSCFAVVVVAVALHCFAAASRPSLVSLSPICPTRPSRAPSRRSHHPPLPCRRRRLCRPFCILLPAFQPASHAVLPPSPLLAALVSAGRGGAQLRRARNWQSAYPNRSCSVSSHVSLQLAPRQAKSQRLDRVHLHCCRPQCIAGPAHQPPCRTAQRPRPPPTTLLPRRLPPLPA
jgi:hypothetical protein